MGDIEQTLRRGVSVKWVARIVLAAIASAAIAGCSADDARTVTGTLVGIQQRDGEVIAVEVETQDGRRQTFDVQLDSDAFVPVSHLYEHVARRLPVVLYVAGSGSGAFVRRIDDVP